MEIAYFIINNIKYMFEYNKYRLEIYKLVNDEKHPLSDKEKEYFDNVLKNSNSYILYQEISDNKVLENKILNNDDISANAYILKGLKAIIWGIPSSYLNNLYKNIDTLQVEESNDIEEKACYNSMENKIILNKEYMDMATEEEKLVTVIHELLHMASFNYDIETSVISNGFSNINVNGDTVYESKNTGLTEGFIEALAMTLVYGEKRDSIEDRSYLVERSLVLQLLTLIDKRVVFESFFNNKGTALMESELCKIIDDRQKASCVFRAIESGFLFHKESSETDAIGVIQSFLLDYFSKKCFDVYFEQGEVALTKYMNDYGKRLITKEKLVEEKYTQVSESVNKYRQIRNDFKNMIQNNDIGSIPVDSENRLRNIGYIKPGILFILSLLLSIGIFVLGVLL